MEFLLLFFEGIESENLAAAMILEEEAVRFVELVVGPERREGGGLENGGEKEETKLTAAATDDLFAPREFGLTKISQLLT